MALFTQGVRTDHIFMFSGWRLGGWSSRLLLFASMLLVGSLAAKEMEEGPLPPLSGDDGYLLLPVDTDRPLPLLRLNRQDSMLGTQNLRGLPEGVSTRVLNVPAGRYRWQRIEAGGTVVISASELKMEDILGMFRPARYDVDDAPALHTLVVEPGKLNYAGELHLRFRDRAVSLAMPNRLEQGLRDAATRHSNVLSFPLVHAIPGTHDPWTAQRARLLPEHAGLAPEECPDSDTHPVGRPSTFELFVAEEIQALALSPDARLVLESAYRNRRYEVSVINPANGEVLSLYAGEVEVLDMAWAGPRRIVVGLRGRGFGQRTVVFTLSEGGLRGQKPAVLRIPVDGELVDALPERPDELLYAVARPDHKDSLQVFRVDLTRGRLDERYFRPGRRIDPKLENDRAWVADSRGELRIALVDEGETLSIVRRPQVDGPFETLLRLEGDDVLWPVSIADDGVMLALSNKEREQTELVRIRPTQPNVMETVHAVSGVDVADVVFDGDGRTVIGVSYYEAGQPRSDFFDSGMAAWSEALAEAFAGRHPELVDVNRKHGRAIVRVSGDTVPPTYYLYDHASGRAEELARGAPWLSKYRFVPRHVLDVEGDDGLKLQALLAMPDGPGPHPLLVMPHGGPFYVQDVLRFNRDVQYWATRGFAVLQVNFRGSYGFGVEHLLAGFGGFGRQIEDDIETAVDSALAAQPRLDGGRVCAVGSSYGGYSALMLGLRDSARFRCVVAIAAPSDLPLLFTSSDWSSSEKSRETMRKAIGMPSDPELVRLSPAYRAEDIRVPVMLIHGSEDRRVDYEHAERLGRRLDAAQGHRLIRIDDMGHGPDLVSHHACMMGSAEKFIREKLGSQGRAAPGA